MVTFNQLLRKVLAISLFSLTLVPNVHGMFWSANPEWDCAAANEAVENQEYENALRLVRECRSYDGAVADWIFEVTGSQSIHVPFIHEEFKQFATRYATEAPTKAMQAEHLMYALISLVITKADVACCQSMSHKAAANAFDILIASYRDLLSKCSWINKVVSFEDVRNMAKETFDKLLDGYELPKPVWVCTVTSTYWSGLSFGSTLTDSAIRQELSATYNQSSFVQAISAIRDASFCQTWSYLEENVTTWDQFFALKAESFDIQEDKQSDNLMESMRLTNGAVDAANLSDAVILATKLEQKLEQATQDDVQVDVELTTENNNNNTMNVDEQVAIQSVEQEDAADQNDVANTANEEAQEEANFVFEPREPILPQEEQ